MALAASHAAATRRRFASLFSSPEGQASAPQFDFASSHASFLAFSRRATASAQANYRLMTLFMPSDAGRCSTARILYHCRANSAATRQDFAAGQMSSGKYFFSAACDAARSSASIYLPNVDRLTLLCRASMIRIPGLGQNAWETFLFHRPDFDSFIITIIVSIRAVNA